MEQTSFVSGNDENGSEVHPQQVALDSILHCGELPMKKLVGLCMLLIAGFLPNQSADPRTNFFNGKQIKVVAGFAAAGIIDPWERPDTQYTGEYIPGNPDLVVQNVASGGLVI